MATNRLTLLANEISENTSIITSYLASKNIPEPSFDVGGLTELSIPATDAVPYAARAKLIAATKELHDLAIGPKESIRHLAWDSVNSLSLYAVYKFKIAQAVPADGDISYSELSTKVNVDTTNLRRLIRHAITNHIFQEQRPGYVSHTSSSLLLAEDAQLAAWVGFFSEDLWLPIAQTVPAMSKWPGSQEPRETGYALANQLGPGETFFDHFAKSQEKLQRYGLAMSANAKSEGYDVRHVIEGYEWGELGEATVIDLGGSQGHISIALAQHFPSLKFQVQELPSMRTATSQNPIPLDLQDQVKLTTHDFFTPQPVKADLYFFRWIFHNWSDTYAIKILRALIPALRDGARILINDGALPEANSMEIVDERSIRTMDLLQFVTVNGREREITEWEELFAKADHRFVFKRAWMLGGERMWFIEVVWKSEG